MRATIEEIPKITRNFARPARTRVFKGGRGSGKTRGLALRSALRVYQLAEMGVEGVFLASREHLNSLDESSMEEIKAATPQVQERICSAAILPGTALVESGANFAQAGANTGEKFYIAQDNYLALKSVDDAWPAGDTVIGMEALDEQFFNVRVPTGTNVARGAKLTTNAAGMGFVGVRARGAFRRFRSTGHPARDAHAGRIQRSKSKSIYRSSKDVWCMAAAAYWCPQKWLRKQLSV